MGGGHCPGIEPRATGGPRPAFRGIDRSDAALALGPGVRDGERKQLNNGDKQTNRSDLQCTLPCCRDDREAVVGWTCFCGEVRRLIAQCVNKKAAPAAAEAGGVPDQPLRNAALPIWFHFAAIQQLTVKRAGGVGSDGTFCDRTRNRAGPNGVVIRASCQVRAAKSERPSRGPAELLLSPLRMAPRRCRVGKGGREISIYEPRRLRRAHAEPLNLPRDFAWARRQERLAHPTARDNARGPVGCARRDRLAAGGACH
jgi:hypothetical protein